MANKTREGRREQERAEALQWEKWRCTERRVQQVSCVVARGDIAVAAVMKDSPVWSCHGDGTQGAESQQEAGGETGHSLDRKSTSVLMGTYRSPRWRAIQERYTITTQHHSARLCTFGFSQSIFFRIAIASLSIQNKFSATLTNGRWIAKIGPFFLSICNTQCGSWCQ